MLAAVPDGGPVERAALIYRCRRIVQESRSTAAPPLSPTGESERLTDGICSACGKQGGVLVTPFRWGGKHHLNWYCRSCGHAWPMAERRAKQRQNVPLDFAHAAE
jgi:hypothetical protein